MTHYQIEVLKKPDVTDLAGEKVMIDFDTGKYFMLTGSANDIWDMFETKSTSKEILDALLNIYEVDEQTCYAGIVSFLNELVAIKFISLTEIA